ncbi:MAG: GGDEF domain-containing protein [Ruminococcus sp.]|nr:GGDEF domain-containing protein [Ruminococcus sp.]
MDENAIARRRLQVGLLVSHLEDDFDDAVCEGAMIAAEQADVNLVIFPGRYIDGVYADKLRTEYEYQYNTLFDLPTVCKFDLLLVLIGTIGSHLDKEHKAEFLKKFKGTPVITITANVDGYPCISIDNKTGLSDVINHLIDVHGCKKIGFVSGPETSDDANERLEVYRDVMEASGLGYDPRLVTYGNFSKYATKAVEDLLDRASDLDAIVFANDQMALAGYQVMEQRGIKPGKDIFVTGFDDDPVAEEIVPHLTTVKADASELGYRALIEAVNYVNNGVLENDRMPSAMVCRNSCGCKGNPRLKSITFKSVTDETEQFANEISDFLLNKYRSSEVTEELRSDIIKLILEINDYVSENNMDDEQKRDSVLNTLDELLDEQFFRYVNIDSLYAAIEYIHQQYTPKLESHDDQLLLNKLFIRIYKIIAEQNASYCKDKLDDNYALTWQTNSITRDMLVFEAYDDRAYQSVIDKLTRLHMISSYLFSYEPAVINRKSDRWEFPDMQLKAYHNGSDAITVPSGEQTIHPNELFNNRFMIEDRRYSMVVSPLFSNEEHYGLLMCEIEHEYFHYIQSVTVQLCAALKIITLMKREAKTQLQLNQSLIEIKENNQLLSELSKQDELTGCYNRRGFFEEVRKRLKDESLYGKPAIMVLADLDDLKQINDCFGHEEGDFAIKSAANILKSAFDFEEIVGRIGGDELVVCAFLDKLISIPSLREHIEKVSEEYNLAYANDKPYIVHTSIGVYPFRCTENVEIGELLSHADALLYEQKKHKKSIMKQSQA